MLYSLCGINILQFHIIDCPNSLIQYYANLCSDNLTFDYLQYRDNTTDYLQYCVWSYTVFTSEQFKDVVISLVKFSLYIWKRISFNNNGNHLSSLKIFCSIYDCLKFNSYSFSVKVFTTHHYPFTDNAISKEKFLKCNKYLIFS